MIHINRLAGCLLCAIILTGAAAAQQPPQREPLIYPMLVFSSSQVKYGLYQNYLHRYMDRPLLMDRSTRGREVLTDASFHKIMDHARMYGLDGLSILVATPGMVDRYVRALQAVDTSGRDDFSIMLRLGVSHDVTYLDNTLTAALASPHTQRVDGKVLCGGYTSDRFSPDEMATMLAELRAIHGDSFLFCPNIALPWYDALSEHNATGQVSEDKAEAIRNTLRGYLQVADGLFVYPNMFRGHDRRLNIGFYRDFVIPLILGVLAEDGFGDKYLGLAAVTGYFNYMSGSTLEEDGTKTLRNSFESALTGRPDFIDMPEWDELNEHTCIEPTITNSFATQRIIRYYIGMMRNEAPQPNPGDDTNLPNLVISYRKAITLGEKIEIELLNVPDGVWHEPYRVQVSLLDPAGETVRALPEVTLEPNRLADVTHEIAGEEMTDHLLLRPHVTVTTADGRELVFADGLKHITVRPTDNWDYKWVKQPVRDLIRPTEARFAVTPAAGNDGFYTVSGTIAGDEPLAFVEVLENGNEVYGVDVSEEYPDRDEFMLLNVSMRAMRDIRPFNGTMSIENAPAVFHTQTDGRYYFNEGDSLRIDFWLSQWPRGSMASIPRNEAAQATLVLDFNLFQRRIPLANVLRHGVYSETFGNGITITLEDFRRLPDITPHVDSPAADFAFNMKPRRPNSVVWMRAITVSGKIYRSAPVLLAATQGGEPVALDVFSDTQDRPVKVTVDGAVIPDIRYEFDPANGSLFYTDAGRSFWGQLGGRTVDVTGVGGGESGGMGDPYRNGAAYPTDAPETAPVYVTEDGRQCLQFDGIGNYIVMPREVTPRRGSWTLEFEIKPTSAKKQVLFAHHGHYTGSVRIFLEDGEIWSQYSDRILTTTTQRPGLKLPLNEWSSVRISYDLSAMTYTVNGETSAPQPAAGPGLYIGTSVFGGLGDETEYFEGMLRSLRMVHRAL